MAESERDKNGERQMKRVKQKDRKRDRETQKKRDRSRFGETRAVSGMCGSQDISLIL